MYAYSRLDSLVENWINETRPRFRKEEWVFRKGDFLILRWNSYSMAMKKNHNGKLSFFLNDYDIPRAQEFTCRMHFIEDKVEEYGKREDLPVYSIPFSMVENARMGIRKIEVFDYNIEKNILIGQNGRKLLVGYDGGAFGSFVGPDCKSIKDALEFLKPSEVIQAEKQDKEVVRQGEYFFIPVPELMDKLGPWTNERLYPGRAKGGKMMGSRLPFKKNGNVHVVHEMCVYLGETYARGSVRHHENPSSLKRFDYSDVGTGQHEMILLNVPHLVVRNKSLGDVFSSVKKTD